MPTREELGGVLLDNLQEVRALLDYAYRISLQEQDALVANDPEAIATSCAAQEDVILRIAEADQRAAAAAERLAELDGLDAASMSKAEIMRSAGPSFGPVLTEELQSVTEAAQRVRDANERNAKLLSNGLEIIATCLQTVASEAQPLTYSDDASLAARGGIVLSLDSLA
jgi:flagellar biosynthesis/type III secretory pathway chaperone